MAEATEPIPQSNLAEQADMKVIVGGIDVGFTTFMNTFFDAAAAGIQDSRASQRRVNAFADNALGLILNDARTQASAQNAVLVGASGARQDTLSSTETEQAMSNAIQAQERLAEDMSRLNAVVGNQRQELIAALTMQQERTAQLENTMSTALAAILAKLDAATNPSTPVGPT
jgi:hypothetical protein